MEQLGAILLLVALVFMPAVLVMGQSAPISSPSSVAVVGKIEGSISFLDLKAQQPMLRLTDMQGKSLNINVDPQLTAVLQNGEAIKLDDLKVGQKVEISQTTRDGKPVAQTIEVLPTGAASAAVTSDRPSTSGSNGSRSSSSPSTGQRSGY